ncbi:CoA-acylating methylmalonate-semialdehyde dehydrogenase [Deinococcus cellulosilyticus]|uniref:methylmalonate-semialdehyde dehydrogenase (CoA acylating) n=1 Tax=Deinococcus cellulosilyticus (strain DSM 18568 / NBRC 106333 / KACC 11606 / 5516J-15) TaxID=1223518 RepID=A0A511MX18_DEIC1|nr:CoA-acylating methylmalonate-semialdehyde dehydrogenase [Deinococcus cellulosilyticus]GEM44707.1 methylmalonate-semialdehyde dehydrogenase (acylating) [Deinococcus cellulosilyticus NBRC 106333 = KACC 11606]
MTISQDIKRISHWVNGTVTPSNSGRHGNVYNPATGEIQATVDFASTEELDHVIAVAKEAFKTWRSTPLSKRADILFKFRDLVDRNRLELAKLLTAEHGKVTSDALGEIARGLENVEFACGIPNLLKGNYSEQASTGVDVYSIPQPLGVVAGITPFNFPAMVPMWMFANAIGCGNTFILKPSEKDPSASLFMADLLKQAGLPDGVFNVVQGDKVAVDHLLSHKDIAAISFVGSTPIAQYVYETGTKHGKRVQALGGAKNHMLVLPDADINMAADAAVSAAYGSAGERCMAISVVVAVGGVGDQLVEAISERLPKLKVGPGNDPQSEMGPLITREHRDKVASYIAGAETQGAKVVVDGRSTEVPGNGFFLGVSLIDNVTPDMSCYQDEIFGPVLCVVRADTYEEGLNLINDNPYGNGTAIFTRDGGVARKFQFECNAGMVGVNVPIPVPVAYYSFGGWKASLFGDTHMYGPDGIKFFTRTKVVTSRWPDPSTSKVDLGFPQTR